MKPRVIKRGDTWTVQINGRLFGAYRTHDRAYRLAWNAATYTRRTRFNHDLERATAAINRIRAAINRIENR